MSREPGAIAASFAEIRHMQVCMLGFNWIDSAGFANPSDLSHGLGRTAVCFGKDALPTECILVAGVCALKLVALDYHTFVI